MSGVDALRQAGINSVSDLLELDFRQFWRKHLILAEVDLSRLGRAYRNYWSKSSRRSLMEFDTYAGTILYRASSARASRQVFDLVKNRTNKKKRANNLRYVRASTQTVLDCFSYLRADRYLIKLPTCHLLPQPNGDAPL
jgi:hypothetical protein